MAYTAPTAGTSGYGGAKYGAGGGGDNRYDYTQWGGGLWSIGIDPAKTGYYNDVRNWYSSQPSDVKAQVDSYWQNNKRTGNADFDLANAVDWRQRDVARKIQIEHGPFDFLGPLAPIGGALATVAGSALGGPIGGALAGGLAGGLGSKSVLGGLLGAAGGYGLGAGIANAGGLGNYIGNIGAGIKNFVSDPLGSVSGLFGKSTGGFTNPGGLGLSGANLYNPASLGGAVAPSTGLGLTAAQLYNPAALGGILSTASNGLGLSSSLANNLYRSAALGEAAPISTPSSNPANVVEGKGGSVLGNMAGKVAGNFASNALSSLLTPEQGAGIGSMSPSAPNAWKVNPYTNSPYPELLMRPRARISNQLVV